MIGPVAGDVRSPFLHLRHGTMESVVEQINDSNGNLKPMNMKNALLAGLFGNRDLKDAPFGSGEDIVLFPALGTGVTDSTLSLIDPDYSVTEMMGMHGGLSREENEIPLIHYFGSQ